MSVVAPLLGGKQHSANCPKMTLMTQLGSRALLMKKLR
jgi:hypothetical protein